MSTNGQDEAKAMVAAEAKKELAAAEAKAAAAAEAVAVAEGKYLSTTDNEELKEMYMRTWALSLDSLASVQILLTAARKSSAALSTPPTNGKLRCCSGILVFKCCFEYGNDFIDPFAANKPLLWQRLWR
jgi:hypothetical protein